MARDTTRRYSAVALRDRRRDVSYRAGTGEGMSHSERRSVRRLAIGVCALATAVAVLLGGGSAQAAWTDDIRLLLTPDFLSRVWQSSEPVTVGEAVGRPPAVPVYNAAGEEIGYIVSTLQTGRYSGYAATPFDIVAGVTNEGEVMGVAALLDHYEPIIDAGVPSELLIRYLDQLSTVHVWNSYTPELKPTYVQGATISATLMRDGVINTARKVLRTRNAPSHTGPPIVDVDAFEAFSWDDLIEIGAIGHLRLSNAEVAEAFAAAGWSDAAFDPALGAPDDLFVELYAALGTPPGIGRNIAAREFERYLRDAGDVFLLVGGRGAFDYLGTDYRHARYGRNFDRIRIVQDGRVIQLGGEEFLNRSRFETGDGTVLDRSGVFGVADASFDPVRPFTIQVLVPAAADGGEVLVPFDISYRLPEAFILRAQEEEAAAAQQAGTDGLPLWMQVWVDQRGDVAVLLVALVVLSLLVWKQDTYTKHRRWYRVVRLGFLAFTFGWLGWYANAQFSVINLLVYFQAPFADLEWTFYLTEPLIVMVALYTLGSLFIYGRSLFCGWLCPFGALQEILSRIAGVLRIPQITLRHETHRKLWWVKYVIWAALIPMAFLSRELMVKTVEVEPFKTAISSHFQREWPFVAYAVGLLAIGLFMERAYCRFVCPLGAGLAALGRFNAVRFLRRRPECGTPSGVLKGGCHVCEHSCAYRAIGPDGRIVEEECFYCLDCQAEYHDAYRCPPLAIERKRGERAAKAKVRKTAPVSGGGLLPHPQPAE